MRILFITPYVPSPVRVRPYQFLRQLSRRHDVVVLTLWQNEQEYADLLALRNWCPTVGVRLSRVRALTNCLGAIPVRTPLQGAYCWSPDLARTMRRALGAVPDGQDFLPSNLRGPFDLVHVEHLRAAFVGPLVPRGVPTLFDSVDCISLLLQRTLRLSHSRRQRMVAAIELARTRAYEARLLGWFDRVIATAAEDARALEELAPTTEVAVVPNGVDLEYFQPSSGPREPATLVMSGKMSYHANVTAALYFVRQIFPLIRRSRPNVRLRIVGSNPVDAIQALDRDPAISVTGYLPDLRDSLRQATVAICPVTVKVGIQNKVLEAMALGLPVVSTREGLEGLHAVSGSDLLVGADPMEFSAQVEHLLDSAELRERIGRAGRHYVETYHRWDTATDRLEALYGEAVNFRARG